MSYSAFVDALTPGRTFSDRAGLPTTNSLIREISTPSTISKELQEDVMDITKDALIQKALAMQLAGRQPDLYKALNRQIQI
jgi:hypothetical protein